MEFNRLITQNDSHCLCISMRSQPHCVSAGTRQAIIDLICAKIMKLLGTFGADPCS